jgi:hypothetical protein
MQGQESRKGSPQYPFQHYYMSEVLREDYTRTAWAKGLIERIIIQSACVDRSAVGSSDPDRHLNAVAICSRSVVKAAT